MGLILRFAGVSYGLPIEYHIDEQMYVSGALRLGAGLPLDVGSNGPNLFYYLLLVEYAAMYLVARVLGTVTSLADFTALYKTGNPYWFFLLARLTSILSGAMVVPVAYVLGARAYDRRIGLTNAAFVAVTFLLVRDSHYGTPDLLVTLLGTAALVVDLLILQGHSHKRWYLLAGLISGLAIGTKLTLWPIVFPLVVAHLAGKPWRAWLRSLFQPALLLAALAVLLGFAIAYPALVTNPQHLLDYLAYLSRSGRFGIFEQLELNPPPGWLFYLRSLQWGLGLPLLLVSFAGLLWSLWRHRPVDALILAFVIPYLLWISLSKLLFARYLLPIIPSLLVLGGRVLWEAIDRLPGSVSSQQRRWAGSVLVLVLMVQPLVTSLRHNALLSQPDTRTEAAEWIRTNIPAGSRIAADWRVHTPPIDYDVNISYRGEDLYQVEVVGGNGLSDHPLDWYRSQGFDYLITTSFITDIRLRDEHMDATRRQFYTAIAAEMSLIKHFAPYPEGQPKPPSVFEQIYGPATSLWELEQPGPVLLIYQVQ